MKLTINGKQHNVEVDPDTPLLWVLRDEIGLTGTKYGCGIAMCGACTVHVNGEPRRSCSLPVKLVEGEITTIEGIGTPETMNAVQQAWVDHQVAQCGFMSGNLCRCGTYVRIRAAIHDAASKLKASS